MISQQDYLALDAHDMAAHVRSGETTAEKLLDAALHRLSDVNPALNAVIALYPGHARERVRSLSAAAPFGGVPFLIKDLFTDLAETECHNGSRFHAGTPARESSHVVAAYEQAGLIIIGRTHSPEFGGASVSESSIHGITRNPFDLRYTSGGSSGGAAAAVASGIVPVAQATDAGGSIIIPASCCGLFGLKPSRGLVPLGPTRVEGAAGLAVQHVLSRSVRDSAALLDVATGLRSHLHGEGPLDMTAKPMPGLRIALTRKSVHGLSPIPECDAALIDTARLCAALGHHVEETVFPVERASFAQAETALRLASVAFTIDSLSNRIGREPSERDFEPETWRRYQAGRQISGVEILGAREAMLACGKVMDMFMTRYDVILTPSLADLPPLPATVSLDRTDAAALAANRRLTTYCGFYNWTGQPAMSVPLARSAHGLPIGLLFAGRHGKDDALLRLAFQLEEARRWPGLSDFMREKA
jgi:Asp-tRNA(Asn)/Glu-tRNA(Gln) amidotransferase A subunit family amidase